jgi:hypothetical protein
VAKGRSHADSTTKLHFVLENAGGSAFSFAHTHPKLANDSVRYLERVRVERRRQEDLLFIVLAVEL